MSEVVVSDWFVGDDPGANMWAVKTAKGEVIQSADVTSWTVIAIDLTGDPTTEITPDANGSSSAPVNLMNITSTLVVDGYWTKNDVGYNVRHYIRNADYTTVPFKAGHFYRFVYRLQTGEFDGGVNRKSGQITLMREGTCKARAQ